MHQRPWAPRVCRRYGRNPGRTENKIPILLREGAISHPGRILARREQPRPSRRGCFFDYAANFNAGRCSVSCERSRVRGGSWLDFNEAVRSGFRYGSLPDVRKDDIGFRVGRTLAP